jgi:hypothetical protein
LNCAFVANYTRVFTPTLLNRFSFGENNFINITNPVVSSPQIDLPSLQEGASFTVLVGRVGRDLPDVLGPTPPQPEPLKHIYVTAA